MNTRGYILSCLLATLCFAALAEPPERMFPDTVPGHQQERTERFFDSVKSKASATLLSRYLYRWLIVPVRPDTLESDRVVDESRIYAPYAGLRIGKIQIDRSNVYDNANLSGLRRAANASHMVTREKTVRRDLLFKPGDRVDPEQLVRTEQLLRSRRYIYDASISIELCEEDPSEVCVTVHTRDSWTISVDGAFSWNGRMSGEIYDANLFGYGNRLGVTTSLNWRDGSYGGNLFEYDIPNFLGTFYRGSISIGRLFERSYLDVSVRKEFIRPTDYALGIAYQDKTEPFYLLYMDSTVRTKYKDLDVWAGRSKKIGWSQAGSSAFFTLRYNSRHYDRRPEVAADLNPYFHNAHLLLGSLGFYREKFYAANLIYGYGVKEYIANGYKAEGIFGYYDGEFGNSFYAGLTGSFGGFTGMGYMKGEVGLGGFTRMNGKDWYRSALHVSLDYFTNLLLVGRSRMRQFVKLDIMKGWNRAKGVQELLSFTPDHGPRGWKDQITGTNRAVLSTETVFFSPFSPLGFRMAFYGYADAGVLGNRGNIFENPFFATIGFGVRIKNERLIFNTIQINIGISLGKGGLYGSDYFNLNNHGSVSPYRYIPRKPEMIDFR